MTVKEFNTIRHAAFVAAMEIEDVRDAFATNNIVYIYEVTDGENHRVFALSYKTQMNNETLRTNGFTENARIKLVMTLDRTTKCAQF